MILRSFAPSRSCAQLDSGVIMLPALGEGATDAVIRQRPGVRYEDIVE